MSGEGMEGNAVLAGEYVLGLLDAEAARAVERLAATDADMAAAIALWRAKLEPLTDLPAPAPPSDALWSRIEADLPRASTPQVITTAAAPPPAAANSNLWRPLALASLAVAAGLAVLIWRDSQSPHAPWASAVAMLAAPGEVQAGLRAQVTPSGIITVVPLQLVHAAAGEKLGFWAWPKGQPAPVLLGLIRPDGGQLRYPYKVQDGTPVMVTREPPTGPGATPGPTLFIGLLATTT